MGTNTPADGRVPLVAPASSECARLTGRGGVVACAAGGRDMLSLRAHLTICGSLLAALVLLAPLGGALQASGVVKNPEALKLPAMVLVLGLFLAFGFSCVPVMVKLVLGAQRAVGNADVPAVRAALRLETAIIWGLWALMAAGAVSALPAAIADGAV